MTVSHNHHYIPQMYLSKWATDKKIFVYRFLVSNEKVPLWSAQSIAHTASLNKLYVDIQDNQEYDSLEHTFDADYESPAKEAFEKIIKGSKMTTGDWIKISDYIVAQYVRTPSFYFYITDVGKAIVPEAIETMSKELTRIRPEDLKKTSVESTKKLPERILLPFSFHFIDMKSDDKYSLLEIKTIIGKQLWLYSIPLFLRKESALLNYIRNLKWSIVTISENMPIPSCDNPVVLCEIDGDKIVRIPPTTGVAGRNKIILFPISPRIVLLGTYTRKFPWRMQADEHMAEMCRKAIVDNALMYIYSNHEDPIIPILKPRVIDSQEFKRYKDQFDTWFENYREEEGPLLTSVH